MSKVAVIGGGAGGMMAACIAAGNGHRVTLFELKNWVKRFILPVKDGVT